MKSFKLLGGPANGKTFTHDNIGEIETRLLIDFEWVGYSSEWVGEYKPHKYILRENVWYEGEYYSEAYVHDDIAEYIKKYGKPTLVETARKYGPALREDMIKFFMKGKDMSNIPNIKVYPKIEEKKFLPYEVVIQVNTKEEHEFMKNALHFGNEFWTGGLRDMLHKKIKERD